MAYSFSEQFQWGVATSAYQIEGATAEEGRSPSVWDQFRPSWQRLIDRPLGTYRETRLRGAEGCDHYHRYPDDIQLIKALGTRHYRFSMLTGAYHPGFLEQLGEDAPEIQPGDLKTIHQPIDFLGLNIYTGTHIRAADNIKGCDWIPTPSHYPKMHMPWLQIVPESLYWGIRHVSETLDRPDLPIYITENGCAANDRMNEVGEILDTDRILYLRQYLKTVHRAVTEGYPVKGYYLWSLLDNFEWSWGNSRRFEITHVDFKTQTRTPKESYHWYQNVIRSNRIL